MAPRGGDRKRGRGILLAPQEEFESPIGRLALLQQIIAGLLRERLEILHRSGVRREHAHHLARGHFREHLLRTQDWQRAGQPACIDFLVEIHQSLPRRILDRSSAGF
ncbi:hypothetical protein ebA7187 [Aromatoleum aromaticum EbN1]|uniref:Uncharacterized protein n=1 Tax=Aromatoleum aromaticum (strain DSM 19018 / LMG 30748 / EbN1) TaxID=76114 RepID=Q5NXL4_AROAE|nr:hypothetical protein ebA7187 [Aromatoleum aromaticum EbN1]